MGLPSSGSSERGNIFVNPQPIVNGEAAVFNPNGQIIRARQTYSTVLTTGAEWLAAMQIAGFAPAGSAFPTGGASGISNPSGTEIQIGDATYTRTVLQGTGITQTLNGATTKWLCEAATGSYLAIYNDGATEFVSINSINIAAATALTLQAASLSFYTGGSPVVRPNLSAARTALPASMGVVYVQAEANAVRNLLAAIADALGNSTGNNLIRTV